MINNITKNIIKPSIKAIFLMGPTATGKTELALQLSEYFTKQYPIEIISVDSALIYTDMNIGTAKPTPAELARVPHHLINIINPLQSYSVAEFIHTCNRLIPEIAARGKVPLLVGGTMMYFNALIHGINQLPESDPEIRARLTARLAAKVTKDANSVNSDNDNSYSGDNSGIAALYDELMRVDPQSAHKIMPADAQRIIRALEVFYITGIPISKLQTDQTNYLKLSDNIQVLPLMILPATREILHDRINQRFLRMLDSGFIDEVVAIKAKYPDLTIDHSSMRCVGYYQAWQYLENIITHQELIDMGSAATRQLAKRQITWLRKLGGINLERDDNRNNNSSCDLSIAMLKNVVIDEVNSFLG
jgi:tRNA dimethylallyltransferase